MVNEDDLKKALSYADHVAKNYFYKVVPGADHIIREGEHVGAYDPTYEGFRAAAREIVMRCMKSYDPNKSNGATFTTYCRKALESGMQEYVRTDVQEIRINNRAQRESKRCRALQKVLAATEGKDPSYARLAKIMGITEARVGELLSVINPFPTSLDSGAPVKGSSNVDGKGDDEESPTPFSHDTVASTSYPNPEDHLVMKEAIIKRQTKDRGSVFHKKYDNFDVYGENWFESNHGPFNNKRGRENGPTDYHEEGSYGCNSSIHVYKDLREGFSFKMFKTDKPFERLVKWYRKGKVYEERLMKGVDLESHAFNRMKDLARMARKFGREDENGDLTFKRPGATGLPSREAVSNTLAKYKFKDNGVKDGCRLFSCRSHDFALVPGDKFKDEPSPGSTAPRPNPRLLHLVVGTFGKCPLQDAAYTQTIGTVKREDLALLSSLEWVYNQSEHAPITREES